jgi:hypothetical protein
MLSKYKITIFNIFWSLALIASAVFLYPFIFHDHQAQAEKVSSSDPILQEGSTRTVWKRGKHKSTTTINEKASQTETADEKSHSSSGWTTINWRKGDT